MAAKSVALVIGAGAGVGATAAKRFAAGGYHACLCRRSNQEGLDASVERIQNTGGTATGFLMDVTKPSSIEGLVAMIEKEIGPIEVAVYNLGAQIGNRSLQETSHKQFEMGWKLGTFGLFRLTKALLPAMTERGSGSLLVTSATSAVRGNEGQHSHAAAMGGRRMLCQSLNAEYASKGVHVCHIVLDGAVDAPDTLGKMIGEQKLKEFREQGVLMEPTAIADTYWHLAHQPMSARTFEVDLRNSNDLPWWNSRL